MDNRITQTVSDTKILVLGIISAALCYEGKAAIVGLILALVTKSLVRTYSNENYGVLSPKANAGRICAQIALVVSVICIILGIIAGMFACTVGTFKFIVDLF